MLHINLIQSIQQELMSRIAEIEESR
jgi:hypothetical protein